MSTDSSPAARPHAVIVSSDTHIGPRLKEQLRPYCPAKYLSAFDDYVQRDAEYRRGLFEIAPEMFYQLPSGEWVRGGRNRMSAGHYDIGERLRDMDFDGVAAEVIFHGSTNDEPVPFTNMGDPHHPMVFKNEPPDDPDLAAVGRRIYNRWLADFCSVEPERHVGLAQIPIWDVEASVAELEWARRAGLRGVNFPAPQTWLPEYNKPRWEPLWSAAEALGMPLVTHFGAGSDADYSGPSGQAVSAFECVVLYGRRLVPWLVLGGVFERHPDLKLMITEIPGTWWTQLMADLDSVHQLFRASPNRERAAEVTLYDFCPRRPSEYCETNLYVGASHMSPLEAETASKGGYYANYLWGSDYPHAEGTYQYPDDWSEASVGRLALRFAFGNVPIEHARLMLGENAARVFDLDYGKLQAVADRIGAPTYTEITEPLAEPPAGARSFAFRRHGTWD